MPPPVHHLPRSRCPRGQLSGVALLLALFAPASLAESGAGESEQTERQEAREQLVKFSCHGGNGSETDAGERVEEAEQVEEGGEGGEGVEGAEVEKVAEVEEQTWLDHTHSYISTRLCEPAAWFDGFFGDPRSLEETPVGTFFRLRNELRWGEGGEVGARARLRANISLPRVSRRLQLLLSRDEELRGEFDEVSDPSERRDSRTRLGLRYIARDEAGSRFDLDGTVRANFASLNPILRARYRHLEPLTERTLGRFTQTAFWERDDGFGTTTRLDWEWVPSRGTRVRWTGRGSFSEATAGVDWRSGVVPFHQLNTRSAVRGELGAFGATRRTGADTEEVFVNFRYRRSFVRPWLFFELQPERAWPQDPETLNREGLWRFTFTLELQFENQVSERHRPTDDSG